MSDCDHIWKDISLVKKKRTLLFFYRKVKYRAHVCAICGNFLVEKGVPEDILADIIVSYRSKTS